MTRDPGRDLEVAAVSELLGDPRTAEAVGEDLDRQPDALREAGCGRIFENHVSGTAVDRPNLTACLDYQREGDVLVVLDLHRLGRRARELIVLIDELDRRGVGFRALNTTIDTTTPADRAFLRSQAALVEMDRDLLRLRVVEGVKAAHARGCRGGWLRVMLAEMLRSARRLATDWTRSIPTVCQELGNLPASALYHYFASDGTLNDPGHRLLGAWTVRLPFGAVYRLPSGFCPGTSWENCEGRSPISRPTSPGVCSGME